MRRAALIPNYFAQLFHEQPLLAGILWDMARSIQKSVMPLECVMRFPMAAGTVGCPRVVVALLLAALICLPVRGGAAGLRVGGTGSGTALLQMLAAQYLATRPGERVEIMPFSLGSSGGVRALEAGKIDLAILGRPLRGDEPHEGFNSLAWARTPLVLATSGGRLEGGLSVPLLADILRKRRTTWDDGSRIRLVMRIPQEVDTILLSAFSPELKQALAAYLSSPSAVVADTDVDAADLLARTPGSLGTTTLGLIAVRGGALTPLPFSGVSPSLKTLADGTYPLAKELHLYFRANPSPSLSQFLDWLQSPEVGDRLRELNHLPLFP